jgi:hypothetical protein
MMYVDVFAEENRVVEFLTGAKILSAFLHQKSVDAFVSGGQAHTHCFQSIGAEECFADR